MGRPIRIFYGGLAICQALVFCGMTRVTLRPPVAGTGYGPEAGAVCGRTGEPVKVSEQMPMTWVTGMKLMAPDSLPKEVFVDSIYRTIVDSGFAGYLLEETARPCSFVKFDYDEWVKYGLIEDVPIGVLNELAMKAHGERKPGRWDASGLLKARCISQGESDSVLGVRVSTETDPVPDRKLRRKIDQALRRWQRRPVKDRTVFVFSLPVFTEDGLYAVIDLDKHCDARQCGLGITCLFRRTESGWKLAGRRVRWGG